jgi:hypothetical protein
MARGQMAFIHGVFGRVVVTLSPSALSTFPKAVVKSGSRSWITNRSAPIPPPAVLGEAAGLSRPHAPVRCAVAPASWSLLGAVLDELRSGSASSPMHRK